MGDEVIDVGPEQLVEVRKRADLLVHFNIHGDNCVLILARLYNITDFERASQMLSIRYVWSV